MVALTGRAEVGMEALRAENIDRAIKGIAMRAYVLRNAVTISKTNAASDSYYRETQAILGASSEIARGASFPIGTTEWEKFNNVQKKQGIQEIIPWEDEVSGNIDVVSRIMIKMGEAMAKVEDDNIYTALINGRDAANDVTISTNFEWNSATRADRHPQDAIGQAIENITTNTSYRPDAILVNPKDYNLLLTNDDLVDAWTTAGTNPLATGTLKQLLGLNVLVSNAVAADVALVLQSKICATMRVLQPLRTAVIRNEGIKTLIRAFASSSVFVTDPGAIARISNTNV